MNIHRNQNEIEQYAGMSGTQPGGGVHGAGHMHGGRTNGANHDAGSIRKTNGLGYSVDFSGAAEGNQAYNSQGKTMEDIMAEAAMTDVSLQKDYMTVMSNTMSDEDFAKLSKEGYDPGAMEPDQAVTIVDKIKAELAEAGVTVTGYNDDMDAELLKKITGSEARARAIMDAFRQYDIPVTEENAEAVNSALDMAEQITNQLQKDPEANEEGMKKYLLENHLQPTIENLYRAAYSGSHDADMQGRGYFAETTGGYYGKKADGADVASLQASLEKVIQDAGCEVSEKTLQEAEWMVESGLPLTAETFAQLQNIDQAIQPMIDGQKTEDLAVAGIAEASARAIQDGKTAKAADLSVQESLLEQAVRINEEVKTISDDAVEKVIEDGGKLDLAHLAAAEKELQAEAENVTISQDHPAEKTAAVQDNTTESQAVTARRQLEEIRLSMSVQVNYHLLKQGISIDTTELSALVENLKAAEETIRKAMFGGADNMNMDGVASGSVKDMSALFRETIDKVRAIPGMPASILGELLKDHGTSFSQSVTVEMVYETGAARQSAYAAMEEKYEPLMTAPMAEYGDSIKKAFRNVDDILREMNLEVTESNQRAVRILGYNSMEISEENIYAVKEAYAEVSRVIDKMTPAATLDMIREGKNPLTMSMEELENYLSDRDGDPQKEMEKYSRYLYRLEQNHEITQEEKESYIGIYRLLHQIEKRDGAAIGSLLQQGAEINFKNLLTAVRSFEHGRMDYNVGDDFGALKNEMSGYHNSITEAIEKAYQGGNSDEQKESSGQDKEQNASVERRSEYYRKLAGDIKANLTPESVSELFEAGDIDLEMFYERQQEITADYVKEQAADVRRAAEVSEQAVDMMLSFDMPHTLDNMIAAEEMISDRGGMARQVMKQAAYLDEISGNAEPDESTEETSAADRDTVSSGLEKAITDVQERFTDGDSAIEAYEQLADRMENILEASVEQQSDRISIKEINLAWKQISLARNMAREENYEIPMEIGGKLTSVNVRLRHSSTTENNVTITMETEQFGKVSALFEGESLSGYIICDNEDGLAALKKQENVFKEEMQAKNLSVSEIKFVYSDRADINNFAKKADDINSTGKSSTDLYETAKAFMKTFLKV